LDWVLWLSASGNSRYFLPMSSVAAAVLTALIFRVSAASPRTRNYVLAIMLGIQGIQLSMGTDFRWSSAPWDGGWIRASVPENLVAEPNLYLTIGAQSNSFIAPYLASGSGMINFSGGYALGPEGVGGNRIKRLFERYGRHIRILTAGQRLYGDDEHREPNRAKIDGALWPFGLRVDETDCATVTVEGVPPDLEFTIQSSHPAPPRPRNTTYLVSCKVSADERDHSEQVEKRRMVELVLDRLEDSCPALFQPRRPFTEFDGKAGTRRYLNTDLTAWVSFGSVKFAQPSQGGSIIYVGRQGAWERSPLRLNCGRSKGIYFASVIETAINP
jgi:hypothetical protein